MTDVKFDELWAQEQAKHPGMSKETFATNFLFGGEAGQLARWLLQDEAFRGRMIVSVFDSFGPDSTTTVTGPDGENWATIDRQKPFARVHTRIEVVVGGESKLDRELVRSCGEDW